jgi:hypothetical protein
VTTEAPPHPGEWVVLRHSGRGDGYWRVLYHGNQEKARQRYDIERTLLRQGGLQLVRPDEETEVQTWAPRLRTRW